VNAPSEEVLRMLNFDVNNMMQGGTRLPFGEWGFTPEEGSGWWYFKTYFFDNLVDIARQFHEVFHWVGYWLVCVCV
jgi:hypothetical protein